MNFLSVLTLTFIVLKLCGVIAWSWWWVLSPLLIPLSVIGILFFLQMLFVVVYGVLHYDNFGNPK